MSSPVRLVQYGLGPIGLECVRVVLEKQKSTGKVLLVGAIDIDPDKIGRDLADLLDLAEPTGIVVSGDVGPTLRDTQAQVVLHTTSSFLDRMHDQLEACIVAGVHVVSSTEELAFPYDRHSELSQRLDRAARDAGVVILGTGVNPGYAMDTLALAATTPCVSVTEVHVRRVVDAGKRRLPLQRKVGAALTAEAFEERKKTGTFGHIGLRESLLMVAAGLEWKLEEIVETLDPVLSERYVKTRFLEVQAGEVAGIRHVIRGAIDGRDVLTLDLQMYVGAAEPVDLVRVVGAPPIEMMVRGGIFGDTATVATLINAIPRVMEAPGGLRTMKDLAVPRAFATR
jgi:2,4-diaminopentanoate dehydrogenase